MKAAFTALILMSLMVAGGGGADLPSAIVPGNLGVNIHFLANKSQDLNMIQVAGARFVRMDLAWNWVETTKGVYNFSGGDALYQACAARGIRVLFILDYGNSLYGTDPTQAAWLQGFTNYAAAAATHYKGDNIIWEIYNEPNTAFWPTGSHAGQYMALVNQVVPALRAADPSCTIVAPALSGFDYAFLTTCFQDGLLNLVDAVSVHPYGTATPEAVVNSYTTVRNYITQYHPSGAVPVISSEWGYSQTGITAQLQGDYLARMFLVNLSQGIPFSNWYDWENDGTDPTNSEDNYGTVTATRVPKPAYHELQLLTQSLNGEQFTSRLTSNSTDWLLVFTSPSGQQTLAAWTTAKAHTITNSTWGNLNLTSTPIYVAQPQTAQLKIARRASVPHTAKRQPQSTVRPTPPAHRKPASR